MEKIGLATPLGMYSVATIEPVIDINKGFC